MRRFVIASFFVGMLCSCDSDDNVHRNIPSVVLNSFHMKYPQATQVEWKKPASVYEVDFEISDRDHSARLDPEGKLVGLKREISKNDLPAGVISGLRRNFDRADLEDPEIVETTEGTFYQLELDQFLLDEKVVLDEFGKINRNLPYWE